MNNYKKSVWIQAQREAEMDVIRNTPTISGGRLSGESILEYVKRAGLRQTEAIERYKFATQQLEAIYNENI